MTMRKNAKYSLVLLLNCEDLLFSFFVLHDGSLNIFPFEPLLVQYDFPLDLRKLKWAFVTIF